MGEEVLTKEFKMNTSAETFGSAKSIAEVLAKKFQSPFSVIFDPVHDGHNNWRVALGKTKTAEVTIGE